jgi:hypothetical protein
MDAALCCRHGDDCRRDSNTHPGHVHDLKTTFFSACYVVLDAALCCRHGDDCRRDTNTHPSHAHDLKTTILVGIMLDLMPRCVAGTEMIAGGTPTRTLVMYMI